MNITGVASLYNVYSNIKTAAAQASGEMVSVTKADDTLEISTEAERQSKIAAFLKNKPITAYEYSQRLTYNPDEADSFIDKVMAEYDNMDSKVNNLKSKDDKALKQGVATVEAVEAFAKDIGFFNVIDSISYMLNYTKEVNENELKNSKIYGDEVPAWGVDAINYGDTTFRKQRPSLDIIPNLVKDTFQDIKIDTETGETWILPVNSDTWVTRNDFIKICPEYKNSMSMSFEVQEAAKMGDETFFKYVENFLAGLTNEEKNFIRENKLLTNPAYKGLGIEGLDEFTMEYTDYPGFVVRHTITEEDRQNIINGRYNDTILNLIPLDQIEEIRNNYKYQMAGSKGIELESGNNTGYVVDYDNYKQHSGQEVDSAGKQLSSGERERISGFLADKPFTAYQYEKMLKYVPLDAYSFITNVMNTYNSEKDTLLDGSYKELDAFVKSQGFHTSDDVAQELAKQAFIMNSQKVNDTLLYTTTIKSSITDYTMLPGYGQKAAEFDINTPKTWSNVIARTSNTIAFAHTAHFDLDSGKMMVEIYKTSDPDNTWVSKEQFVQEFPDFEISLVGSLEQNGVKYQNKSPQYDEAIVKYVENYLAQLTPDERHLLNENKVFSNPLYQELNIRGLSAEGIIEDYDFAGLKNEYDAINGKKPIYRI